MINVTNWTKQKNQKRGSRSMRWPFAVGGRDEDEDVTGAWLAANVMGAGPGGVEVVRPLSMCGAWLVEVTDRGVSRGATMARGGIGLRRIIPSMSILYYSLS
jgi:hypothetical protein